LTVRSLLVTPPHLPSFPTRRSSDLTPRQNVSGDFRLSFPGTHPLTLCFISLACVLGALWSLCQILFVFKRLASRPPDAQLAKFLLQALPVQPDGRRSSRDIPPMLR